MKNKAKTLGITAVLALMIPMSAYAATITGNSDPSSASKSEAAQTQNGAAGWVKGGFGRGGQAVGQEVLDLLKLDKAAYEEKAKAGATLAEIAEQQGVTREQLKAALTAAFDKRQAEQKKEYADNLDKLIDGQLPAGMDGRHGGGKFGAAPDLTSAGQLLGLTVDELKTQLESGKSLADLAASKGVETQKLIDAQVTAIKASVQQKVTDGKLTQAQADERLKDVVAIAEKIVNGKGFGEGRRHGGDGKRPDAAKTEATESASTGSDS
ncbi:hypothetical protein ACFPPD_07075 [Cohnella suwonensis]|uniref:LysM domain-containing protein n=1 Tax=Cohnella suwonensis TaxID=696072 RepID=A0ABW0LU32_9BACL